MLKYFLTFCIKIFVFYQRCLLLQYLIIAYLINKCKNFNFFFLIKKFFIFKVKEIASIYIYNTFMQFSGISIVRLETLCNCLSFLTSKEWKFFSICLNLGVSFFLTSLASLLIYPSIE